jgi:hypothetical protein
VGVFLHHTGCNFCGSSDAFANYSDGSGFCFSCRRTTNASGATFDAKEAWRSDDGDEDRPVLPHDLSHDFPVEVFQWIEPTGLKIEELIKHGYFFSKTTGELVRVLFQDGGEAVHRPLRGRVGACETRQLNTTTRRSGGPKARFRGSKEETIVVHNLLQPSGGSSASQEGGKEEVCHRRLVTHKSLVLVEDSLSAIKVGRQAPCEPLFGSSISLSKLIRLVKPFKHIFVWLDSDKLHAARQIAEQIGLLGKPAHVIYTELDPKYESDETIQKLLRIS